MPEKGRVRSKSAIEKHYDTMRAELWPEIGKAKVWKATGGYTSIPRTFPYILNLMDNNSEVGPISKVFVALWSRAYSQMMVEVKSPDELAAESGFLGQRKVQTWRNKMKQLVDWGFVNCKPGHTAGEYTFCLILNPHGVVDELIEDGKWEKNGDYYSYANRKAETKQG